MVNQCVVVMKKDVDANFNYAVSADSNYALG